MIHTIPYSTILPIWQNELWPDRKDPIEPISWMKFNGRHEDNSDAIATYFGWVVDGAIVGVNSGHTCADGSYRSRGLWVHPDFRRQGIAHHLLAATVERAAASNATLVWSFPRRSSWKTYERAGFLLVSPWEENINNINAYCYLNHAGHHQTPM